MNLTNEQIQAILDGAPEGDDMGVYFDSKSAHYISDLREILTLRQEVERLKSERDEALDGLHDAATQHQSLNAIKREAFIEGFNAGFTDCWIVDEEEHADAAIEIANQRYPD